MVFRQVEYKIGLQYGPSRLFSGGFDPHFCPNLVMVFPRFPKKNDKFFGETN